MLETFQNRRKQYEHEFNPLSAEDFLKITKNLMKKKRIC